MTFPLWLHPILRKVFSNLVNDKWTKAGRPILADGVTEVECGICDVELASGRVRVLQPMKDIPMNARAVALIIEEDRDHGTDREHHDGEGVPQEQDEEEDIQDAGAGPGRVDDGRDDTGK